MKPQTKHSALRRTIPLLILAGAIGSVLVGSPAARADENSGGGAQAGAKNAVFFGTDFGLDWLSVPSTSTEIGKNGTLFTVKLVYSHYFEKPFLVDIGAGWFHSILGGDIDNVANTSIRVTTDAWEAELSPRWRIDNHWQVGPVGELLGGADVGFSESGAAQATAFAGGARLEYETPIDKYPFRAGLQSLTTLGIDNRQVTWVQLDLQIGIFVDRGPATSEPAPEPPKAAAEPEKWEGPAPAVRVSGAESVTIELSEAVVHFDTAKALLSPKSRHVLDRLGGYLSAHPGSWKTVHVEGHSDKRGRLSYNNRLSLKRAESVAAALGSYVAQQKVYVRGFGPAKPVDPADTLEAYAKNRRVEVHLEGVVDPAKVVGEINDLYK